MILAVFGTVYAICLAILALVLFSAKPLAPVKRPRVDAQHDVTPPRPRTLHDRSRDLIATHH
ncbi:MAG: hypothetical protein H0U69_07715 [Trueperaceae bacterium]|nr:hypothetical protein [Trueperaceae bacterium]